jgi:predicted transglutaminase-like cysteine proteinase
MGGGKQLAGILLVALGLTGCQSADLAAGSVRPEFFASHGVLASRDVVAVSSPIPQGALTEAPSGFVAFCERNPDQCRQSAGSDVVALDNRLWQALWDVNTTWNTAIKPMEDAAHYGRVDYWTIPTDGYGDCEDYALGKRKSLIEMGLPSQALRIGMAQLPDGEAHAVLTVVTDRGDYVLDNLSPAVLPWKNTGYVWVARQSVDERQWASVNDGRDGSALVAANIGR